MSGSDSRRSSEISDHADSTTINTAPRLNKHTAKLDQDKHAYFVPLVVMIVLGVIVVATFYSKEFNSLIAGSDSPDHADGLMSDKTDTSNATTVSVAESADTAGFNAVTNSTADRSPRVEENSTVIETAVSDSSLAPADTSTALAKQTLFADNSIMTSQPNPQNTDSHHRKADYFTPPMAYGMPGQYQNINHDIWQQRHRVYEATTRARRQHMMKMTRDRATALRRMQQDRLHQYKRMREFERQGQNRQDELMPIKQRQDTRTSKRPV